MSFFNLQPTDRCVVKKLETISETNTVTRTIRARKIESFVGLDGATNVFYEGTGDFTTTYPIKSVKCIEKQLVGGPSYTVTVTGEKSYQIRVSVQYAFNNGEYISLNCSVKEETEYIGEVEKEVYVIQEEGEPYCAWQKAKPVTLNFDTSTIDSVRWEEDTGFYQGGGGNATSSPITFSILAGGYAKGFEVYPKQGYVVTSESIPDIDLSNVAALLPRDFLAETFNITAYAELAQPVITHTLIMPTSCTISIYNPNAYEVTIYGTTKLQDGTVITQWGGITLAAYARTTKNVTFSESSFYQTLTTTITFQAEDGKLSTTNIVSADIAPAMIEHLPVVRVYKVGAGQDTEIHAAITNNNNYAVTVGGYHTCDDGITTIDRTSISAFDLEANSTKTLTLHTQVYLDYYYCANITFSRGSVTSTTVSGFVRGSETPELEAPRYEWLDVYANEESSTFMLDVNVGNINDVDCTLHIDIYKDGSTTPVVKYIADELIPGRSDVESVYGNLEISIAEQSVDNDMYALIYFSADGYSNSSSLRVNFTWTEGNSSGTVV